MPHVLCLGFNREETEDFLIELNYLGIDNVLAVRGDENGFKKPLQYGRTANEYALDLVQQIADMNQGRYLERELVDAEPSNFCVGIAGYPEKHFEAPNRATDIRNTKAKVDAGGDYLVTEIGVEWATKQAEELLNRGLPALHFYPMQSSKAINMLMGKLRV